MKKIKPYKWSDDPGAQIHFKKVTMIQPKAIKSLEDRLRREKAINKRLREKIKTLSNVAKRENDKWYQITRYKKLTSERQFKKVCGGFGYCIICDNIDLDILQEHHIFGRNYDEFTVTMCPNCHRRLHRFMGGTLGSTTKTSRKR